MWEIASLAIGGLIIAQVLGAALGIGESQCNCCKDK